MFAFDSETKKAFITRVRNVGSKRHFNRIEVDGVDPNALEDITAEAEAVFAEHLTDVIASRSFPTHDHFNSIMNLIANLSVRNPRLRSNMEGFEQDICKAIMDVSLSSEEIWKSQIEQMREAGYPVKEDITYEDMRRFHESKAYDIVIDQTHLIGMEVSMIDPVLDCCARRNWCFVTALEGSQYITSDDPVALIWQDRDGHGPYSPGHGLEKTIIFFPLCSELLLMGKFEASPKEMVHLPEQVVTTNTIIARHSTKQIYARDDTFVLNLKDRSNVRGSELVNATS